MSAAMQEPGHGRGTRLSVLVSGTEAEEIARRAAMAGLSVSAFLRGQALGREQDPEEAEALRMVDQAIERMSRDVDAAIAEMNAVLARLAA